MEELENQKRKDQHWNEWVPSLGESDQEENKCLQWRASDGEVDSRKVGLSDRGTSKRVWRPSG
jgi:hypothetical protein